MSTGADALTCAFVHHLALPAVLFVDPRALLDDKHKEVGQLAASLNLPAAVAGGPCVRRADR